MRLILVISFLFSGLFGFAAGVQALVLEPVKNSEAATRFVGLLLDSPDNLDSNFIYIETHWQPGFAPMAVEVLSLARRQVVIKRLINLLQKKTGQDTGYDINKWFYWVWQQDESSYVYYPLFKSLLYGLLDPKFTAYFDQKQKTLIRLDEVRWGGVLQDGIPPLRQPKMISVDDADYLDDNDVVFGVKIKGDARAYPKRILAWHEMFVDEIGGTKFVGVYCTLCGAVILYESVFNGIEHHIGTSGFLYRSNKLMYDKATQSLWNTTWGVPVIGPLAGQGIRLKRSYLVTTTWGEWKKRHPQTTVLSLDTGYQRDYGEGVAYRQYFATDKLMFNVPKLDNRLRNKDEVLALIFPQVSKQPLAIAADYLSKHPVYHHQIKELKFVVLTDRSGANRVYQSKNKSFVSYDGNVTVIDSKGRRWLQTEKSLRSDSGEVLNRLPAHRAFWFGWYAANNDTLLIY